jgi:hypothetical protein
MWAMIMVMLTTAGGVNSNVTYYDSKLACETALETIATQLHQSMPPTVTFYMHCQRTSNTQTN